jgi:hypothetical protein
MRRNAFNVWFGLPIVLALPVLISAQSAPHPQTLVVNGQAGKTTVVQVNGRSFVDVEALAQIANGTVAFKDNQITLTVPASAASGIAGQQSPPGFSKEFLSAAIESIAAVREWRTGIATAIQNSISVTDSWVSAFQRQASDSLRQASVAAVTATDRAALQLLTNEYNNMRTWSDHLIAARKTLQYMSPDDMNSDPLFQQVLTCSHSLAAMVGSGQFQDDPSCAVTAH